MDEHWVQNALRGHRLLSSLTDEQIARLVRVAEIVEHAKGTLLFREGDSTSFALLVMQGAASLELCAPALGCRRILTAGPGELVGWSAMLGQTAYTATARVIQDMTAIKIDTGGLRRIFSDDYRIGYEVMLRTAQTLAKRLHAARLQAADVYGKASESIQPPGEA